MKRAIICAILLTASLCWAQDAAQPTLPTTPLQVNGKVITAEVADDAKECEAGLMFRKELAKDSGMLFVLPGPERATFWMKNTLIPLSVAYINAQGVILEIHDMKPLDETPIPSAFSTISYALEMTKGWFADHGVLAGDRLEGLPKAQ